MPAPTKPAAIGCCRTVSATLDPAFFTPAIVPPCCSCGSPRPDALPLRACDAPSEEPRPRALWPGCDLCCDSGRDCFPPDDLPLDDSDRLLLRCCVAMWDTSVHKCWLVRLAPPIRIRYSLF